MTMPNQPAATPATAARIAAIRPLGDIASSPDTRKVGQ